MWGTALKAQESESDPAAHANVRQRRQLGLLQVNAAFWSGVYGYPVTADLDADGVANIVQSEIHSIVDGRCLR